LFAGSDRGGQRAAAMYSLIVTALCRIRHRAVYAERRTMPSRHSPAAAGMTLRAIGSA